MNEAARRPSLGVLLAATIGRFFNQWRERPNNYAGYYHERRLKGSYPVTPETALGYSVVFACMRVISETLAMLPWRVYERQADGTTIYRPDNPVNYLLTRRPNPDMTAMSFREHVGMQMSAWGNAYCEIQWNNAHQPIALWQIPSWRVRIDRDDNGNLIYVVSGDGTNTSRTLTADNVLHFRNVGFDGVLGVSTIALAAQTISYGMELQQFGARAFQNAPFLGGWLEYPMKLDEGQADRLKQSWRQKYMGWLNAGEVPILESGMKLNQLQLPLADAQFLESRVFTAQEICRWFRVPQHKVGLLEEASYSNIEALGIDCYNETFLPMTCRLEQELDYKLFEGNIRTSKFFSKHSLLPILKGDLKTRYEAYSVGVRYGWLSINDVLQMEDMNEVANGDLRTVQLNTVPLDEFEPLARVKLQQAEADLEYRQVQTEKLDETGVAPPDANAGGGNTAANNGGDNGQNLFEPTQAENPPDDEMKTATQAAFRRARLLQMERERIAAVRAPLPRPDSLGVQSNGVHHVNPPARPGAGRRPH